MGVRNEVAYICDCCGAVEHLEVIDGNSTPSPPLTWRMMIEPFGLCCNKCMKEFMDVYERIHAPEKARKMYKEEGYGR